MNLFTNIANFPAIKWTFSKEVFLLQLEQMISCGFSSVFYSSCKSSNFEIKYLIILFLCSRKILNYTLINYSFDKFYVFVVASNSSLNYSSKYHFPILNKPTGTFVSTLIVFIYIGAGGCCSYNIRENEKP